MIQPHTEAPDLPNPIGTGEQLLGLCGGIVGLAGLDAIIASLTIRHRIILGKVIQQFTAPARRTLGVAEHEIELIAGDLLLLRIRHLIDEMLLLGCIACAEEENAIPGNPSRPARPVSW